jgi:5'-deoxynucleotidase YfbR-like HD superfamily hydrolase
MNLAELYLSGEVRRYHQYAALARLSQTNADHQGRCVQLLLALYPAASVALLRAAAVHDVGELIVGDLGVTFKRAHPELASAHAEVEAEERDRITGWRQTLTVHETRWLKLIDRLEAHCFALTHAAAEYRRPGSGWERDEGQLLAEADFLCCGDAVRGLLHDLKAGVA